jgi:hypothetical protein
MAQEFSVKTTLSVGATTGRVVTGVITAISLG